MIRRNRQLALRIAFIAMYTLLCVVLPGRAVLCEASGGHVAIEATGAHCPQTAQQHGHDHDTPTPSENCDSEDCTDTTLSIYVHDQRNSKDAADCFDSSPIDISVELPAMLAFASLAPSLHFTATQHPDAIRLSLRAVVLRI